MRIVVTGGHLTPAIAVISQLRKLAPKSQIYFFGRRAAVEGDDSPSFEYLEIKKAGFPFFDITTGRLQRRLTRHSLVSLMKFLPGLVQAAFLLKKIHPQLVLTFGGYLGLPVAVAAKLLQIPVVAHEQSFKLGLSNQIIFKFARLCGVSQRTLAAKLQDSKVIFTGPLLREEIFKTKPEAVAFSKFLKNVGNSKLIYITGGATGSHFLNQIMVKLIPELLKENFIIHQTGNLGQSSDFKKLSEMKKIIPSNLSEKYFLTEFVNSQDIGAVLARADLVICRSGANTTAELAALAKVAIVIPLSLGLEQKQIGQNLAKTGVGLVILQDEVTAKKIFEAIKTIFANFEKFASNALIWQRRTPTTGAAIFAKKILALK